MRALVTGASGFVGKNLVSALLERGDVTPVLLGRSGSDFSALGPGCLDQCRVVRADTVPQIIAAMADIAPDLVYHCAGRVLTDHRAEDVEDLIQSNLALFIGLLEGLSRLDRPVRMVNMGTYLEHDETGQAQPNSLYSAMKLALSPIAAFYGQTRPLFLTTLKTSIIYGPNDQRMRLMRLLTTAAAKGDPLRLSPGEQIVDVVHVRDVVSALLLAGERCLTAETPFQDSFFVMSDGALSLRALADRVAAVADRPLNVTWGAVPYKDTEVMRPYLGGPRLPGWHPKISLDAGVREMLDSVT